MINIPKNQYTPPTSSVWNGRNDGENRTYFHQIVNLMNLPCHHATESAFGIIGFCSDEGIRRNQGRPGASAGPNSMRESLGKLPIISPKPFNLYDFGDIHCVDGDLESSQKSLGIIVKHLFQQKTHPIIIGGGHEVAWGSYQGIASSFPQSSIGIINFDAHYDLRPLLKNDKGSSGTPFYQISIDRKIQHLDFHYLCIGVQPYGNSKQLHDRAKELNVETIHAEDIFEKPIEIHKETIRNFVLKCDHIFLSICLDVFQASISPGVSAPQILGLYPWQVIPLIREIVDQKKTLCIEIAELSPPFDINQQSA